MTKGRITRRRKPCADSAFYLMIKTCAEACMVPEVPTSILGDLSARLYSQTEVILDTLALHCWTLQLTYDAPRK